MKTTPSLETSNPFANVQISTLADVVDDNGVIRMSWESCEDTAHDLASVRVFNHDDASALAGAFNDIGIPAYVREQTPRGTWAVFADRKGLETLAV